MRRFPPTEDHNGFWTTWESTTPPSTPVGSTWRKSKSAFLQSQCLNRRLDNAGWLDSEIRAWEERRNKQQVKIHWSFTIAVARHKLKKLYPVLAHSKLST